MNWKALILQLWLAGWFCLFSTTMQGQSNPWDFTGNVQSATKKQELKTTATYRTVRLDFHQLSNQLRSAPLWQTDAVSKRQTKLAMPMPDGTFQPFNIQEAPVMHPELGRKYPQLKAYLGTGIDDPSAYLRFDVTPSGIHAMILSGNSGDIFIDPVDSAGSDAYIVYFKKDFQKQVEWKCETPDNPSSRLGHDGSFEKAGDCKLRTYRLALACTGEYAQFHGGTVASALAAMHTTMTRVNGIFERDLSISMQLVPNNDQLVFTNANTDPFTNNNGSSMLSQNQTTCNDLIGNGNYDIGHVFSTGGGGIAYVKSVCNNSTKASGVTGMNQPAGDAFNIDYVAHEMGHQFGANHTQNNNCNRNPATSVEPGSGSTIMGYAGVCAPNIQNRSDAYFHAVSLAEISAFVAGNGGACATVSLNNTSPSANAGPDYTIPKSTYFVLTGSGSDNEENGQLTYCWEQMDNQLAVMPPVPANASGPSFRSLPPYSSPARYFPNLTAIINNQSPAWEVLPGVERKLNFRLTVRDNKPGGGCFSHDDVLISVDGTSGPFLVTFPNSEVHWTGGEQQTITWDAAGTNASPVNCEKVDILLSLDGGLTYTIALANGTPNDGSHTIEVPNAQTNQARVMVKGTGNIFFDISNSDFSIKPAPSFSVTIIGRNLNCHGDNSGAAKAYPSGNNSDYAYTWSNGANTAGISSLPAGTYTVTVTSGGESATASIIIEQPPALTVSVEGVPASAGKNGTAKAMANGGAGGNIFSWSNGVKADSLSNLGAGIYTVTVTDVNGCSATASTVLAGSQPIKFENGTINAVTGQWQTVHLEHTYNSMVVVASLVVNNNASPSMVTRIRNAHGDSFEIKVQEAGGLEGDIGTVKVYYLVAEEGVYTPEADGVKFEAKKVSSTKTSSSANWQFEQQSYSQFYRNPVVIGQVMSFNDPNWSVFWASKHGSRTKTPTWNSLSVGKHVGEDIHNPTRVDEIIGYLVFDAGPGFINGKKYAASVGSDIVRGMSNNETGYSYTLNGFDAVTGAVASPAAMDGSEGAWPVLRGPTPTNNSISLYAVEDQIRDAERSHTSEQIAFIVFGSGPDFRPETTSEIEQSLGKPVPSIYVNAFPNPATEEITVEFEQKTLEGPVLTLYNSLGHRMYQESLVIADPGIRRTIINVSKLEPGYYFLELRDDRAKKILKMVIAPKY